MKKMFYLFMLGAFVTGCTNNKLVCTNTASTQTMDINQKYKLIYDGKKISDFTIQSSYSFKDEESYKSFEVVINNHKNSVESLKNDKIKYTYSNKNQKYKYTLKVKVKDVNEEELETLGLNADLSNFKENLKNSGFKCK